MSSLSMQMQTAITYDVTPPGDAKGNILMTKHAYIVHHNITTSSSATWPSSSSRHVSTVLMLYHMDFLIFV